MLSPTHPVTGSAIRTAIEARDGQALSSFYRDDAVMKVIDRMNPPSNPREIAGREAIDAYWNDVCGRAMTHKVETTVAEGNTLAFTQACEYPDGMKVFCSAVLELKDGRIAKQTVIQAWDE